MNFTRGYETWEGEPIVSSGDLGGMGSCGMGYAGGCGLFGVNFDTAGNPVQAFGLDGLDYAYDEDMGAYVFDLSGLGYAGYYYADNPNDPGLSGFYEDYYDPGLAGLGRFRKKFKRALRKVGRVVKKVAKVALPVLAIAGAPALGIGRHTAVGRVFGKGIMGKAKNLFGQRGSGQTTGANEAEIQLSDLKLAGGTTEANKGNPANAFANFLPQLVSGFLQRGQAAATEVTGGVSQYVQQQLQALAQRQQALQMEVLRSQALGVREVSRAESAAAAQAAEAASREAADAAAEARRAQEAQTLMEVEQKAIQARLAAQRDKATGEGPSSTTIALVVAGAVVGYFALKKLKVI